MALKGKKATFSNTSTGYGKTHKHHHKTSLKSDKNQSIVSDKEDKKKEPLKTENENEQDLNSGFGDYLRTPEAVEMMKLFVFANSIMLILTMAWPNLKEQYYWLMQWLNE